MTLGGELEPPGSKYKEPSGPSDSPEQEPSGPSLFRNCLVLVLMWGSNQMSPSVQLEPSGCEAEAGTFWQ